MSMNITEKDLRQKMVADLDALGEQPEYMSQPQIDIFKTFLVGVAKILDESYARVKQQIQNNHASGADEADRAQVQSDLDDYNSTKFSIEQRQRQVRDAFKAMRDDEFGYCTDCGAEIGLPRMIAMPWSIRDADCAGLHEIKLKQDTGRRAA